jgi:hypothetical protein
MKALYYDSTTKILVTKTKKNFVNDALYLGEPCHSTLEVVAGNLKNNSSKTFISQVDICPPAPSPRTEMIQRNVNSDVCLPPTASVQNLELKICSNTFSKAFNVTKGDMAEIVASMSSPR